MRNLRSDNLLLYAICLTVALALGSCNRKAVYSHYEHTHIDGWGWERSDTLTFSVPPLGEGGLFSEELGLRTTTRYPFTSLTLIVSQRVFPSGLFRNDTVTVRLTDDIGNRLGDGMNLYQHTCTLPVIQLNEHDSLSITVSHYMKRESLPGISDIGLTVKRMQ